VTELRRTRAADCAKVEVEVLETSTTRMPLRQKAFMDSHLWIARFGCDAFPGTFGNATRAL
jgi:hypothetical protein